MELQEIKFQCEIISPMFSGEAIKGNIELRPPAFKASLRYWWRALHAHLDLKELQKKENQIFGGGGEYSQQSVIKFVSLNHNLIDEKKPKLPHKQENRRAEHNAFTSGTFSIKYRITNTDIFSVEDLTSLMYISSVLGGLGARARRGMGAWRITNVDITNSNTEKSESKLNKTDIDNITYDSILKHIEKISKKNNTKKNNTQIDAIKINKNIRNRYPFIKEIHIGKNGFDDVDDLTELIIKTAHNAKNIFNDECFKIQRGKNEYKYSVFDIFVGHSRRLASPIYISIIKKKYDNNNEKCYPVITVLHSPDGYKCKQEGEKLIKKGKKLKKGGGEIIKEGDKLIIKGEELKNGGEKLINFFKTQIL
jgi:CRISPR-associated protein Cmr1